MSLPPPAIVEYMPLATSPIWIMSNTSNGCQGGFDPCALKLHRTKVFAPFFAAIKATTNLATGWNGYSALVPNAVARKNARQVVELLQNADFAPDSILASADGGIAVVFKQGDRYADIECFNNGEVFTGVSEGKSPPQIHSVELNQFEVVLSAIRAHIKRPNPEPTTGKSSQG